MQNNPDSHDEILQARAYLEKVFEGERQTKISSSNILKII